MAQHAGSHCCNLLAVAVLASLIPTSLLVYHYVLHHNPSQPTALRNILHPAASSLNASGETQGQPGQDHHHHHDHEQKQQGQQQQQQQETNSTSTLGEGDQDLGKGDQGLGKGDQDHVAVDHPHDAVGRPVHDAVAVRPLTVVTIPGADHPGGPDKSSSKFSSESTESCVLELTTYNPSRLEQEWVANVRQWGGSNVTLEQYCSHLSRSKDEVDRWLARVQELMSHPPADEDSSPSDRTMFSFFTHKYKCSTPGSTKGSTKGGTQGTTERDRRVPIEPLVGGLRHPLYACHGRTASGGIDKQYLLDKRYLLLDSPQTAAGFNPSSSRSFVFDLGASLYSTGLGGASQDWFVDTLRTRGFTLEGYFAWEVQQQTFASIYGPVPDWLIPRYHYFNTPASTDVNDPANPFNLLKRVARKDDYVLVKLDIDNTPVEMKFIQQMLQDTSLTDLIDEFFFEHHVKFQPMYEDWVIMEGELEDSYRIFSTLRRRGVRAHGWV